MKKLKANFEFALPDGFKGTVREGLFLFLKYLKDENLLEVGIHKKLTPLIPGKKVSGFLSLVSDEKDTLVSKYNYIAIETGVFDFKNHKMVSLLNKFCKENNVQLIILDTTGEDAMTKQEWIIQLSEYGFDKAYFLVNYFFYNPTISVLRELLAKRSLKIKDVVYVGVNLLFNNSYTITKFVKSDFQNILKNFRRIRK